MCKLKINVAHNTKIFVSTYVTSSRDDSTHAKGSIVKLFSVGKNYRYLFVIRVVPEYSRNVLPIYLLQIVL